MGLVIIGVMLLYLFLSIATVRFFVRYAREKDKNVKRWGLGAALIMYLIPFWDWIPTVVVHKYYCVTEAGFTVFKTLDEWKTENPGVLESLVYDKKQSSSYEKKDNGHVDIRTRPLNARFSIITIQEDMSNIFPIVRRQEILKDVLNDRILAQYIDFSSGNSVIDTIGPPGPLKFWMSTAHCQNGRDKAIKSRLWMNKFKGIER